MIKIFSISILLSVLSVILIVVLPVNVFDNESKIGPSPYRVQIDELYAETSKGLPPDAPAWKQLEELRRKNNAWFETGGDSSAQLESLSLFDVLKRKSSKASLLLMVIWGLGFYFIHRANTHCISLLALAFPLSLFVFNIISIVALILITIAVLGVYLVTSIKKSEESKF